MNELLLAILVEEFGLKGLCEIGGEIMRCTSLEGLLVLHHCFDRIGPKGARKLFAITLEARNHWHR